MAILIYFARAVKLLRCCVSRSFRAQTQARWQATPKHLVIFEVGTGVVGLMAMVAIIVVFIIGSRK